MTNVSLNKFGFLSFLFSALLLTTSLPLQAQVNEIFVSSKSPKSITSLLSGKGKEVKVRVTLSGMENYANNGLVIVLPSSTPNMEDEVDWASKMSDFGFATAIVYGAEPRITDEFKKFSQSYTSAMIVSDLAETISAIEKAHGEPKKFIAMGGSTGSLALLASQMTVVANARPQLSKIRQIFMLNAACVDKIESGLINTATIYAVNGADDVSTAPFVCENTKKLNQLENFELLTYPGGHHFMSQRYGPTREVDGKHLLTTCSLNYDKDGMMFAKKRNTENHVSESTSGFNGFQKWVIKTCLRKGHLQGYEPDSAKKFWSDVKRLTASRDS